MTSKSKTLKFLSIGRKKGSKINEEDPHEFTTNSDVVLPSPKKEKEKSTLTISGRSSKKKAKEGSSSTISGRSSSKRSGLDSLFIPPIPESNKENTKQDDPSKSPRSFIDGFLSARDKPRSREPSPSRSNTTVTPPIIDLSNISSTTTSTTTTSPRRSIGPFRVDKSAIPSPREGSMFSPKKKKKDDEFTSKRSSTTVDLQPPNKTVSSQSLNPNPIQTPKLETVMAEKHSTETVSLEKPKPSEESDLEGEIKFRHLRTTSITTGPRTDLATKQKKKEDAHGSTSSLGSNQKSVNSSSKVQKLNEEEEEEEEMLYHTLKDRESKKNKVQSQRDRYAKRKLFRMSQRMIEGEQIEKFESEMLGRFETDEEDLFYPDLPDQVFSAYRTILEIARNIHPHLPTPELVFIGPQGVGKSSFIEGFLGHKFTHISKSGSTRRPIQLLLLNNPKYVHLPLITVVRDELLAEEYSSDIEVSLDNLPKEIQKRSQIWSEVPILIKYEYHKCWNITIIDTPGLLFPPYDLVAGDPPPPEEISKWIIELVRPHHRIPVCVEEAQQEWDDADMPHFIRTVDPNLERSVFIYTKFYFRLRTFLSVPEIDRYLSKAPSRQTFFVTQFSLPVRNKAKNTDEFQEKVFHSFRRDMDILDYLKYPRNGETPLGLHRARDFLLLHSWKFHCKKIPGVLADLQYEISTIKNKLRQISQTKSSLSDHNKLRPVSTYYVSEFMNSFVSQLIGPTEANIQTYGKTLKEEIHDSETGDWIGIESEDDLEELKLEWENMRLFGGQQFERLLNDFMNAVERLKPGFSKLDIPAASRGYRKMSHLNHFAHTACIMVSYKLKPLLGLLTNQLLKRSKYIMISIVDIVQRELFPDGPTNTKLEKFGFLDLRSFPYFTSTIREMITSFFESKSSLSISQIENFFFSTELLYWDLKNNLDLEDVGTENWQIKIMNLSEDLFDHWKFRIMERICSICYENFYLAAQLELPGYMQEKLSSFQNEEFEELFMVSTSLKRLNSIESSLIRNLDEKTKLERILLDALDTFVHTHLPFSSF